MHFNRMLQDLAFACRYVIIEQNVQGTRPMPPPSPHPQLETSEPYSAPPPLAWRPRGAQSYLQGAASSRQHPVPFDQSPGTEFRPFDESHVASGVRRHFLPSYDARTEFWEN